MCCFIGKIQFRQLFIKIGSNLYMVKMDSFCLSTQNSLICDHGLSTQIVPKGKQVSITQTFWD